MKEVYWREQKRNINAEKTYPSILSSLHAMHHNDIRQTFLCSECKQALYTLVKVNQNSYHFRNYKIDHAHTCPVYPFNAFYKLKQETSFPLEVTLDFEQTVILDVKKRFKDKGTNNLFKILKDISTLYVKNLNKFSDEDTIIDKYKKMKIKTNKGTFVAQELFLEIDEAGKYYLKDEKKENQLIKFVFGKVNKVFENKKSGGYNILMGAITKDRLENYSYIYVNKKQMDKLINMYGEINKGDILFFSGKPRNIVSKDNKTTIYYTPFNDYSINIIRD